ncbi:LuxR C-terminal-related transcriptional regulator [Thalassolituus marinus]|nr:LuxR C-terminal-related transcriptional regulator [Thalassolituus marinus]
MASNTIQPSPGQSWLESLDQRAVSAWVSLKGRKADFPLNGLSRVSLLGDTLSRQPIAWLNAPAGYGKSVLMGEYARSQEPATAVIWLTVDNRDAPADIFLRHFLEAAEHQVPGIATDALAHWHETSKRGRADTEQVLMLWLQELTAFDEPLLICLDDLHNLYGSDSFQVVMLMIEQLPAKARMVLSSRFIPEHLGRLQLSSRLGWLRPPQLSFTDDDVQQLLLLHGIDHSAALVPDLMQRLQGWPAGIAIWLLCYRAAGRPADPSPMLAQQELQDYLNGETLLRLDEPLRHFLQQASVLGTFNEMLLTHCTGSENYHQPMQQALRLNLFVEPLQHHVGWYRMHPVMASLMAAGLPLTERQMLHRRAFQWLSQRKEPVAALYHARKAEMGPEVLQWVAAEAENILANLDIAGLLDWFDVLGDDLLHQSPRLMAIAAWAWLLTHQREKAERVMDRLLRSGELPAYEADALQGYLARLKGQLDAAQHSCRQALEHLPQERYTLRILMSSTLAQLSLAVQDADGARIWNRLAQDLARQYQAPAMEALSLFDYARIELNRGHIRHSGDVVEQGLTLLADGARQSERLPRGRLLLYRAMLQWLHNGEAPHIDETLQQGIAAAASVHDVCVCYGYAVAAMRNSMSGQYAQALNALGVAERLMQRWRVEPDSYQWLQLVKVNVWISEGKISRAQKALDEYLNGRTLAQLPRPELFPMLPGFAVVTQGRLFLAAAQYGECLQQTEQAVRGGHGTFVTLILQIIRATAMRQQSGDGNSIQQVLKLLEREGVGAHLLQWIPTAALTQSLVSEVTDAQGSLSERELEVLRKIAQGYSNQEIADQLFISLHTVKTHARKINVKLAAKSRTQAIRKAQELNLI